jgi:hypothetical protein
MTETFSETLQGWEVRGLRSETVEVAVMPALGAKIARLTNRRTGREWMWTPPEGARFRRLLTGAPFPESSLVGADECIPTIAPCRWRGRDLPDHGEVWTEAWEVDADAFAQGAIRTSLRLPVSPLRMERCVTLEGSAVQLDYTLRSLSDEPYEYLWALHPLLTIAEGDRLELPEDCARVRTDAAMRCPLGDRGDAWAWPCPMEGIHLDRLDLGGEGRAVKLYTDPLSAGYAAIVNERTGERLTFAFDAGELNTLGIWLNRGGWNGYHHLAVEPTNGAPDPLDMAVREWKRFGALEPGAERRWRVRILVDSAGSTRRG